MLYLVTKENIALSMKKILAKKCYIQQKKNKYDSLIKSTKQIIPSQK